MPRVNVKRIVETWIVHVLFILFKLIVSLFSLKNVTPILRILSTSVRLDAVSTCVYYQTTYYTLSTYLSTVPPLEKKVSRRGIIVCLIAQSREGDIYFQISFFSLIYLFVNMAILVLLTMKFFIGLWKFKRWYSKESLCEIFVSHLKMKNREISKNDTFGGIGNNNKPIYYENKRHGCTKVVSSTGKQVTYLLKKW